MKSTPSDDQTQDHASTGPVPPRAPAVAQTLSDAAHGVGHCRGPHQATRLYLYRVREPATQTQLFQATVQSGARPAHSPLECDRRAGGRQEGDPITLYRPDVPRHDPRNKKKNIKYENPLEIPPHLDCHPSQSHKLHGSHGALVDYRRGEKRRCPRHAMTRRPLPCLGVAKYHSPAQLGEWKISP